MQPWQPLLDWWFGVPASAAETTRTHQPLWFGKQHDQLAAELFASEMEQALAGRLDSWQQTPQGWLAGILLLDQLPRMIHRDSAQAFAGDAQAQVLAERGMAQGWHLLLPPIAQVFVYLVLEHAEDLSCQQRAVDCLTGLYRQAEGEDKSVFAGFLEFAERHRQIIQRFGRFPHRNAALGRASTAEELAFLQEPGSSF